MAGGEQDDTAQEGADDESLTVPRGPERALFWWFCAVLAADVAGVFWLALRTESPTYLRGILDLFVQGGTGAVVAYVAFRALFLYAFRITDLMAMVLVLWLGLLTTAHVLDRFSGIGLIPPPPDDDAQHLGILCQWGLIMTSMLVAGAALGLRHCTLLKTENPIARAASIVAGMLVLPAVSGTAAFLVPVFLELDDAPAQALLWLLAWLLALAITGLNIVLFIKTLTLREEVGASEKLP